MQAPQFEPDPPDGIRAPDTGFNQEQIELMNSPEFWSMIRDRRKGPTIPWETVKQQLKSLED